MKTMVKNSTLSARIVFMYLMVIALNSFPAISHAQCTSSQLATSYASNNGSRGAMFNIVAGPNPVTITGFSANLYGGTTAKYEIYYKAGTYVGSETTAANWTMAGSVNSLYAAANNVPTYIPITMSVTIPANATYGFYVTNTASGGLNYNTSAVTNVTLATNSDLSVVGGVGKAYPFSSTYSYRLFNGTVHYTTGIVSETSYLATSSTSSPVTSQSSASSTLYGATCGALITKVVGSGASPISGNSTAKVWVETTPPASYVKRHYEITPENNASTSTGTVTLYFTQAEFDAFNALNVTQLPQNAADAENYKANIRIEKRGGTSSNGTGLPNTYPGSAVDIIPTSVSWNASSSRWEVTFSVTGFSGFFAKSTLFTLPLRLLSFSVSKEANANLLVWQTADELQTKEFIVEGSEDGIRFTPLAQLPAAGSGAHSYQYRHSSSSVKYYRLKMVDLDGRYEYSNVVAVTTDPVAGVQVSPNPAKDECTIRLSAEDRYDRLTLVDLAGRIVRQQIITGSVARLNLEDQPNGIYLLLISSSVTRKQQVEKLVISH